MILFLNGAFLPESEARVAPNDRGFLYGDGVFETLLIRDGQPVWWDEHIVRLQRGLAFLGIGPLPAAGALRVSVEELRQRNHVADAVLRITVSRGVGARGYAPAEAGQPTLAMSLHPLWARPESWKLALASWRVAAGDPLASIKSANKLNSIVATLEARQRGADQAIWVNTDGHLAEGSSANLFWLEREVLCTPPLRVGILPGITREKVLERAAAMGLATAERLAGPETLARAEGVFLTLSTWGVVEASAFEGQPLRRSPLVVRLARDFPG